MHPLFIKCHDRVCFSLSVQSWRPYLGLCVNEDSSGYKLSLAFVMFWSSEECLQNQQALQTLEMKTWNMTTNSSDIIDASDIARQVVLAGLQAFQACCQLGNNVDRRNGHIRNAKKNHTLHHNVAPTVNSKKHLIEMHIRQPKHMAELGSIRRGTQTTASN